MTKHPRDNHVVLGFHAESALNIYVRNGDELHQAARVVTVGNVNPAAVAAMMADLDDALDWRKIAVAVPTEVSPSGNGLPRAGAAAEVAAPAKRSSYQNRGLRRSKDEMARQKDIVLAVVSAVPQSEPVTVPVIAAVVKRKIGFKGHAPETSVRGHLQELWAAGLVGRVMSPRPNGTEGYVWFGLTPEVTLSE